MASMKNVMENRNINNKILQITDNLLNNWRINGYIYSNAYFHSISFKEVRFKFEVHPRGAMACDYA